MSKEITMQEAMLKIAERMEALADAVEKDAAEAEQRSHQKQASAASFDYGTVGSRFNPAAATDPLTQFCIS